MYQNKSINSTNRNRNASYKTCRAQNIAAIRQDKNLQYKTIAEKSRLKRSEIFDKNRNLPKLRSDKSLEMEGEKEATIKAPKQGGTTIQQQLEEWREKKAIEKLINASQKKPFLPASKTYIPTLKKSNTDISYSLPTTLANITSTSSKSNTSASSSISRTSSFKPIAYPRAKQPILNTSRVTRSQTKKEDLTYTKISSDFSDKNLNSKKQVTILQNDLAWMPEDKRDKFNFKVKRKSMRFSLMLNSACNRSPFVFGSQLSSLNSNFDESLARAGINKNLIEEFCILEEFPKPLPNNCDDLIPMDSPEVTIKQLQSSKNDHLPLTPKVDEEIDDDDCNESLFIGPAPTINKNAAAATTEDDLKSVHKENQEPSIDFYVNILSETTDDLLILRDRWRGTLNTLTEACDHIRSAIGHTELLVNKKFKQFDELITDAKINPGQLDFVTRCSDLQGFWDMVYREVENIQSKYSKLVKMAENGFEAVKSTHKPIKPKSRQRIPKIKKEISGSKSSTRYTRSNSVSSMLKEEIQKKRQQLKDNPSSLPAIVFVGHKDDNFTNNINTSDVIKNSDTNDVTKNSNTNDTKNSNTNDDTKNSNTNDEANNSNTNDVANNSNTEELTNSN